MSKIYWCSSCVNYVTVPHKDSVDESVETFIPPTNIISAIENTKGEAVFF